MKDGISVIICTYDDPKYLMAKCLDSLIFQEKIQEIIVVDSSKKDEIKNLCQNYWQNYYNGKINYVYTPPRGLSDARNKGIQISKKDIVAFTDADCIADKNWAENIYNSFKFDSKTVEDEQEKKVAIVGGKVLPKWLTNPNKILLNSAMAQGFYSLYDMGAELKEVDQIFGGNFAINKRLVP